MKKLLTLILICIGSVVSAQIPNYVPSNGLVGWWPFYGNANDESGNGNHGTVNGATLANDRNGVVNSAFSFNGINCCGIPDPVQEIFISNQVFNLGQDYTISCWMESIDVTKFQQVLFVGGSAVALNNEHVPGKLTYAVGPGTSWDLLYAPGTTNNFQNNIWYHVVFVKSGTNYKLFLNTSLEGSSVVANSLNYTQSTNLRIGSLGGGHEVFKGSLDDIGIWNRALTACEIQDLYQAQLGYTTLNAGLDQNVCTGNSVVLQGSGGNFLTWNNGVFDGVPFTPNQTAAYVLTGADTLGCVGVDTVVVTVLENSTSSMSETALDSYTWPVNGQTYTQSGTYTDTLVNAVGCDSVITLNLSMEHTGIGEFNQVQFYLIPNPNDGNFIIQSQNEALINSIQVTDLAGQILFESKGNQTEFQFGEMHSGTYFVIIQTDLGEQTIKYVKQ